MGNRFQMQEYDLEVKNSGVANTFEQWMNNFSTGALPKQIVDHLVQSARDYKDATAAEVQAAKGEGGGQGNSGGGVPQGGRQYLGQSGLTLRSKQMAGTHTMSGSRPYI